MDRKGFLRWLGAASLGMASAAAAKAFPTGHGWARPVGPVDDRFWQAVQAQYRFAANLIYFNTGGLGPAPLGVQATLERITRELQTNVETGHRYFDTARLRLAQFLGAHENEIGFVRNATEANGIIALGLDLQSGDEVIFESEAHPGGSFPWLHLVERGIVVKTFEPDHDSEEGNIRRIENLMTDRTRVVQVSHVTAPTGLVMPVNAIAKLCAKRGVWFHLDGAQSAGMFPFRLTDIGCDSFATSGHKWLGAPHETGLLFVRRDRMTRVNPPIVGAHSAELSPLTQSLDLRPSARRFEYGTRNAASILALAAAAEWQEEIGRDAIAQRGRELVARLRTGLHGLPDVEVLTPAASALSASILTFRSPRMSYEEIFRRLFREHGLRCRPVSEQGLNAVRVSCHLFNSPAQIDRLLESVQAILRPA